MTETVDTNWQAEARVYVPALDQELPLLLNVEEAGALAGLSRFAAYRAVNEGAIPSFPIGERRIRVPTAAWLDVLGLKYGPREEQA